MADTAGSSGGSGGGGGGQRPDLRLDGKSEQGFCAFFNRLPEAPAAGDSLESRTLRLFERNGGEFYSVHGEDALYVAQTVYKTTTVIKHLGGKGDNGLPSCTLSRLATEAFLRESLLVNQHRVEIWAPQQGSASSWKVMRRASPGNLQDVEDLLGADAAGSSANASSSMPSAPVVMAIRIGSSAEILVLGAAMCDPSGRVMSVVEFMDNELYSNLESLAIQLNVKECLVPPATAADVQLRKLKAVLERSGIVTTELKRSDFATSDIEQDLNRLLAHSSSDGTTVDDGINSVPVNVATLPEFELKIALGCIAACIKYLSLLSDESNHGRFALKRHHLSDYMKLDAAAVRALNLVPMPGDGSNTSISLFGLLNKCKTIQGSRLLAQWLKQPLLNTTEINDRLALVELFVNNYELRTSLQNDALQSMPDLIRLTKRLLKGNAGLQEVVRVYQVITRIPVLVDTLQQFASNDMDIDQNGDGLKSGEYLLNEWFTSPLTVISEKLYKLQEMVETTVDLKMADQHEYMIKPQFDQVLVELRSKIDESMSEMINEQQRVSNALNMEMDKKLKLEKTNVHGYCLRLTRTDATVLRNKSTQYIELATQKTGVYFTTTTLRQLGKEYATATDEYNKTQTLLVKEIVAVVASYHPIMEHLNSIIAKLDVLLSFAHVSVHAPTPYVRPNIIKPAESENDDDNGCIVLDSARHPCLEVQDDVAFIPNNVNITRKESSFSIITGPNMGGKSTYIRQVGVIVLMAQIGCFVPCSSADITIVDCILARVGAGDSQLRGISTFMAEMLETASILRTATRNSLIIIDELGRGTSTYDGFGLAWAISEHIITQTKSFCLFATHFHELTAIANEHSGVANLHVTVRTSDNEIALLYRVKPGVCDQSFGIHVAQMANFPDSVVRLARRKAAELEDFGDYKAEDSVHAKMKEQMNSYTPDQIEQGYQIVHEFMTAFKAKMDEHNADEEYDTSDMFEVDQQVKASVKMLQELYAEFETRINASPFARDLIEGQLALA
ncbi:DNA mismatch repair protein MSH2 [Ramicandelaber brevisporus]|nr:DNA mismatch repair protein MSH2 [Ramicandelaber brevisporus]